jgi:ribonuclease HIII
MNFVLTVNETDARRVMTFYRDFKATNPNEHIRFFAKTDLVTITLYHSGKLVFQGQDANGEFDMWNSLLHNEASVPKHQKPSFHDYFYPSIGSDEVGKGDVFGPVIICSAYLPLDKIEEIKRLGIQDSKLLSDEVILKIGKELIQLVPYSVLTLHNEKYNELVKRGYNLNKMVAYLHNRAILNVYQKINGTPEVFLDQFVEERLYFRYLAEERNVYRNITFLTKAETHYASVAIASIIARYALLRQFDQLSRDFGYDLRKGAGAPVDAVLRQITLEKGIGYLEPFTKMNYKNVTKLQNIQIDE